MDEEDLLDVSYGCMECSNLITITEGHEQRCPHCRSESIKTMGDILADAVEYRAMINGFGLDSYEEAE